MPAPALAPAPGLCLELGRQHPPLALGQPPELAILVQCQGGEKLPRPGATPAALASEELADGHRRDLPRTSSDHLNHVDLAGEDRTLEARARESDAVRVREGL